MSRQTNLPLVVRLKVTAGRTADVAERLAPMGTIHRANDHGIDLSCLGTSKMALFRQIAGLGDVIEDMDVAPPRLDDIYNHFMEDVPPQ